MFCKCLLFIEKNIYPLQELRAIEFERSFCVSRKHICPPTDTLLCVAFVLSFSTKVFMFKDGDTGCVHCCVDESQTGPAVASHSPANDSFDSYG